jgi:2'-hydroxyisoflavone reductase
MRLLVIGGTVFVGRHIVEAALAGGHTVSVFHRGHTPIPSEWDVKEILGDRDGGLETLNRGYWDAVIDCVGYVPRLVRDSAEALTVQVGRYLFISTVSVYSDPALNVVTPNPPLTTEVVDGKTYGPLKVECENVVREVYGDKATIVRPGLVAGPYDPTCRFDYWVDKFTRYKRVLVPQMPESPLELIDARDLAQFVVSLLERDIAGTFDAVGAGTTFGEMIEAVRLVGKAEPVFANTAWLAEHEVQLGRHFPFTGYDDPTSQALMKIYPRPALQRGLRRRPLEETVRATAAWTMGLSEPRVSERSGLPRAREEELLAELAATT